MSYASAKYILADPFCFIWPISLEIPFCSSRQFGRVLDPSIIGHKHTDFPMTAVHLGKVNLRKVTLITLEPSLSGLASLLFIDNNSLMSTQFSGCKSSASVDLSNWRLRIFARIAFKLNLYRIFSCHYFITSMTIYIHLHYNRYCRSPREDLKCATGCKYCGILSVKLVLISLEIVEVISHGYQEITVEDLPSLSG